jgi:outer membrane protein OmpA-like peptidoglycan-associated protein
MAGKDKKCTEEFNALKDRINKAEEVYRACRTEEAIAMAKKATDEINALCPAIPRAEIKPEPEPVTEAKPEPKAEKPVFILVSEPKAEEKVEAAVLETKAEEKVIILVLAFEDVHFDFDKSTLKPEAQVILKRNIQMLKDNPKAKIRIAGYTSASGTHEYNQKLSERRANAVQKYLVEEGIITQDRLSTIGYGETRPEMYEVAPKQIYSKAAKANMRVLFEIIIVE